MSVSVLNTDAGLSGKTLDVIESNQTITGLKTFDRGTSAPIAVVAGAAVVANLDADKLDGIEGAALLRSDAADRKTAGDLSFDDSIAAVFGTGDDAHVEYDGTDLLIKPAVVGAGDIVVQGASVEFDDSEGVTLGTGKDATLKYDGTNVVLDTAAVGSGALSLTKGQILFPASQNASTNANTLDDYEEGVWTPAIGGSGGQSGQVYTTQVGSYIKIGKLVHCQFRVQLSTLGTITTSVQIQGLPFTSENTANQSASLHIGLWQNFTTALVCLCGRLEPNATAVTLSMATAATTSLGTLVQADLAATTYLDGSITYRATA